MDSGAAVMKTIYEARIKALEDRVVALEERTTKTLDAMLKMIGNVDGIIDVVLQQEQSIKKLTELLVLKNQLQVPINLGRGVL